VHGWIAPPSSDIHRVLSRVAQFHEDIQLLQFRKEDLEDQVLRGGSLRSDEIQLIHDIDAIERFAHIENATQLSPFGLDHLSKSLPPGSMSILFRNDHFSTLYKHPQSHQLFTLITDAGYADHAELVWESLVDVNGSNAEFFAGDFRPVGLAPASPAASPAGQRTSSQGATVIARGDRPSAVPAEHSEQTDADYAYALSLQFQEEARREMTRNPPQSRSRRASTSDNPNSSPPPLRATHESSASAVTGSSRYAPPAPGRSGIRQVPSPRLNVPLQNDRNIASALRNSLDGNVNTPLQNDRNIASALRSSLDGNVDDAPPSYEQVARNKPYDHQLSRPARADITPPYTPRTPRTPRSPNSEYGRAQFHHGGGRQQSVVASPVLPERSRERNKDCIVM
jgi:ubiquitin carboxyl-terminal hydrolase MINDY-1/2